MINNVVLSGRWTKNNELRYTTNNQTAILYNTLANDRGYGEKKKTNFITIKMMGKLAESISKITEKGTLVEIVGEVDTYSDKENKTVTVILAKEVVKMPGQKTAEGGNSGFSAASEDDSDDLPF